MNYLLEGGGDFHSELLEAICKDNTNKSSNLHDTLQHEMYIFIFFNFFTDADIDVIIYLFGK